MIANSIMRRAAPRLLAKDMLTRQVGGISTTEFYACASIPTASRRACSPNILAQNFSTTPPTTTAFDKSKLKSLTPEIADKILGELKAVDANFDGR